MTKEQAIVYLRFSGFSDEQIKAIEGAFSCEDAISRAELLKAIDTWDKFGCDANTRLVPYQDHYIPYIHYDDVVKCIKGMPPVNPQKPNKWIPVSERLPEKENDKEDRYLTTILNEYDNSLRYVMTCDFINGCWCPDDECASNNVVAWMPLPEPYKKEGGEKE